MAEDVSASRTTLGRENGTWLPLRRCWFKPLHSLPPPQDITWDPDPLKDVLPVTRTQGRARVGGIVSSAQVAPECLCLLPVILAPSDLTPSLLSLPSCRRLFFMQSGSSSAGAGPCGTSGRQHIARIGSGKQWPVPTTARRGSGQLSPLGGRVPEGSDQSEWSLLSASGFPHLRPAFFFFFF